MKQDFDWNDHVSQTLLNPRCNVCQDMGILSIHSVFSSELINK